MESTPEYYCVYCDQFQYHMDVLISCSSCNEYKGLVKVSEHPDLEAELLEE
jgi:hypothetical protein